MIGSDRTSQDKKMDIIYHQVVVSYLGRVVEFPYFLLLLQRLVLGLTPPVTTVPYVPRVPND